jgi:heme/copper-type cytochrome/quinol oxidase subunit 3
VFLCWLKAKEEYMRFKFKAPTIMTALLLSSVVAFAASSDQKDSEYPSVSMKELVMYGFLGTKFLSSPLD